MPASDNAYSDELLIRYLLSDLPAEQAEKLDELSVADDEFAWRLSGVENDLVDGFVRGKLQGESLQKFQSFYLSSARRRQKVEFATGLLELEKRATTTVVRTTAASRLWWRWVSPFRQWSFAAAALALLLAAGYLFTDNLRLRRQANDADLNRQNSSQHEHEMQQELDRQRAANAQAQNELDRARGTSTVMGQLNTVALLLPSPTRDLSHMETVPIHQGTDLLVLLLTLESDDFPRYRVTLEDPATRQEVWLSTDLGSSSAAGHKTVAVSIPAKLLRQQRYLAQLKGIQSDGRTIPMSGYPFSVVLR
jgi:hypothetical protein